MAVTVLPTLAISDWLGQLKGGSSFAMNQVFGTKKLEWQKGYGIVSFAARDLPWVRRYIENQKEHHTHNTTSAELEKFEADVSS